VQEISGGCFCCRFNTLIDAAHQLRRDAAPDFFLAEPVGSCTDLVATVSLPLQTIYGQDFDVAPLSIVVDPLRALAVLGFIEGKSFSPQVLYIYQKQLEEADAIIINKIDLLTDEQRTSLVTVLSERFPAARLFCLSARENTDTAAWFDWILTAQIDAAKILGIDYQQYGDGEALLGWFNASVHLSGTGAEWDGNAFLTELSEEIRFASQQSDEKSAASPPSEIAHLKMTLNPAGDPSDLAAINLVGALRPADLSHRLGDPLEDADLLINLRAEANPAQLQSWVQTALDDVATHGFGLTVTIRHAEHFRPGQPEPTHRLTTA
jgi:hypothetical protein